MKFYVETTHIQTVRPGSRTIIRQLVLNRDIERGVMFFMIGVGREKTAILTPAEYEGCKTGATQLEMLKRLPYVFERGPKVGTVSEVDRMGLRQICEPYGDKGIGAYKHLTGQTKSATPIDDALKALRAKKEVAKAAYYADDDLAGQF